MSTTTIRLPDELKERVANAAASAGTSAHSFMLDAIAEKTLAQERRKDFLDVADMRYARMRATGKAVPWSEMRDYLQKKIAGKPATRPVARKIVP